LYHEAYQGLESAGALRRPMVPDHCRHNAHMYYLLLSDLSARTRFIEELNKAGVNTVFHYVPLHSSPAGRKYGRTHGSMTITERYSERLVRMPMWYGLEDTISYAIERTRSALHR
jgi:dTDP-4-amino-4,6-dideoxygalactose transaminase